MILLPSVVPVCYLLGCYAIRLAKMYQHFRGSYCLRPTLSSLSVVTFQNTAICIIPTVMSQDMKSKDMILGDHNLTVNLES